jgi:hypothetical protein
VASGSKEVAPGLAASFCLSLACPKIHRSASRPPREDVASGSVEAAPGLAEDVVPGSEEVAQGLAAWFCLSLVCPKIHRLVSRLPREGVAPVLVEVAPGSAEDVVAPGSEAGDSVSVSTGDLS